MVKLKTIQEWREAVHNPPKCCVNCDHYPEAHWKEDATCQKFKQSPPQEFAESENNCPEWVDLLPF